MSKGLCYETLAAALSQTAAALEAAGLGYPGATLEVVPVEGASDGALFAGGATVEALVAEGLRAVDIAAASYELCRGGGSSGDGGGGGGVGLNYELLTRLQDTRYGLKVQWTHLPGAEASAAEAAEAAGAAIEGGDEAAAAAAEAEVDEVEDVNEFARAGPTRTEAVYEIKTWEQASHSELSALYESIRNARWA